MLNASDVPMMFRAPVEGRCQLQYIDSDRNADTKSHIDRWVSEWTSEVSPQVPNLSQEESKTRAETRADFQTQVHQIAWRFVSNSGADPTIILPVIGARGFPYYPGSSMKGAFRQACHQLFPDKTDYYCGDRDTLSPGILRFHGGYPTSDTWTNHLIDLAHPQQGWQVKNQDTRQKDGGAFVQISLYQPELRFGISSPKALTDTEWQEIWQVWQRALSNGIGCRVSAGYGKPITQVETPLYRVVLKGQGVASTLLDKTPEFRPNIFRAGLRGHALRIFGSLCDANTAEGLVQQLFGGIQNEAVWGLLNLGFRETTAFDSNEYGDYKMPYYTVKGELTWLLTRSIEPDKEKALKVLVSNLMQFAMLLGGFGKSWRRIDHQEFYSNDRYEKLIGCHWTWQRAIFSSNVPKEQLQEIGDLIDRILKAAKVWMKHCDVKANPQNPADWREAWCRDRAQIWGRVASSSVAIEWFHKGYDEVPRGRNFVPTKHLRGTAIAGFTGTRDNPTRIGRLWHRMYPVIEKIQMSDGKIRPRLTEKYLELLTFFPDPNDRDSQRLSEYLQSSRSPFSRCW
jgi:CRISPR-associated protein Cmr6